MHFLKLKIFTSDVVNRTEGFSVTNNEKPQKNLQVRGRVMLIYYRALQRLKKKLSPLPPPSQ